MRLLKNLMSGPLVSVVLPVYNAERYIYEAVESVLAQTFQNFELIVIDDGSTDSTATILRDLISRDSRLRVISGPNVGYTSALITGINSSSGEFIARMDADDICTPKRFEKQVTYLTNHLECAVVGGMLLIIDSDGDPVCHRMYPLGHEEIDAAHLAGGECGLAHPATMFRRTLYKRGGGYRAEYEPAEDLDLWFRMGELGRLANLPDVILKYRVHPESTTSTRIRLMQENTKRITLEGCLRRGIAPPDQTGTIGCSTDQCKNTLLSHTRGLACQAWDWRFFKTARKHARRQLKLAPFSVASWVCFFRCYLGPISKPVVYVAQTVRRILIGCRDFNS